MKDIILHEGCAEAILTNRHIEACDECRARCTYIVLQEIEQRKGGARTTG